MKKSSVLLLSVALLAAAVPATSTLADTKSQSENVHNYKGAEEAKKAAEAKAKAEAAVRPFVIAERQALVNYNKALTSHNTIVERFSAADQAWREAAIEAQNVRKNVTADLEKAQAAKIEERDAAARRQVELVAELRDLDVDGKAAAAAAAQTQAEAAAAAVEAYKLQAPGEGAAQADVDTFNTELKKLQDAAAASATKAADLQAKADAAAARELPLQQEIVKIDQIINDINTGNALETLEDNAAVKAALAKEAAAKKERDARYAEMTTSRAVLDAAKVALDKAIADNKEAHYKYKLTYNAPEVAPNAKSDVEKAADKANGGANAGGSDQGAANTGKKAAKTVDAAKTATGSKKLPKTSAAK
ncbi:TPA: hypothetical protein ACHWCH_001994 [Streptococcus suis]